MLDRIANYLKRRVRDPVTWLAAFFIAPWILAAIFGWSPVLVVNSTFFVAAVAEWTVVIAWKLKERSLRAEILTELGLASDRWKPASLMFVGVVLLGFELWLDSVAPGLGGVGVTLFGASSLLTGWYAWRRPVLVARSGLIIGASMVPWEAIQAISPEDGVTRIDFMAPHYYYGQKLRVSATDDEGAVLRSLLSSARVIEDPAVGGGTA